MCALECSIGLPRLERLWRFESVLAFVYKVKMYGFCIVGAPLEWVVMQGLEDGGMT